MKYIRTKDGVYEICKETENGYNIITKPFLTTTKTRYYLNPFISKERVIEQADTIEELCDMFVYVYEEGKHFVDAWFGVDRWAKYIYGAIWTDKGLIYVAKLNDKGELKLL